MQQQWRTKHLGSVKATNMTSVMRILEGYGIIVALNDWGNLKDKD